MRPPARPQGAIDRDLVLAAMLEGRPFPKIKPLGAALGISASAAFRLLSRLRHTGVLRVVSLARARDDACECVVYLETNLMTLQARALFDDKVRRDPAVVSAARLSGRYELRIEAIHADVHAANTWFRTLTDIPGVVGSRLNFSRTVFRRWTFAAAILGKDHPSSMRS